MCYYQDQLELLAHGNNKKQSYFLLLLLLNLKLSAHNAERYYYLFIIVPGADRSHLSTHGSDLQWPGVGLGFPARDWGWVAVVKALDQWQGPWPFGFVEKSPHEDIK